MPVLSPLKIHGGKSYLATKIRALFPPHQRYVETHFGGGAVLFAGDGEGVAEFANDVNGELTNFWAMLQSTTTFDALKRLVEATPFSQVEFDAAVALDPGQDYASYGGYSVARAHNFFIRNRQSRQALAEDYATPTGRHRRGMNEQVSAWLTAIDGLPEFHARLRRVEIRCQPAEAIITELDEAETLFFMDPPYVHSTRKTQNEYGKFEMTDVQHHDLLTLIAGIKGKFALSGYRCEMYDWFAKQHGWRRVDFDVPNQASSAKKKKRKTESLWMNYDA
jgi:DNA adenine methylase